MAFAEVDMFFLIGVASLATIIAICWCVGKFTCWLAQDRDETAYIFMGFNIIVFAGIVIVVVNVIGMITLAVISHFLTR